MSGRVRVRGDAVVGAFGLLFVVALCFQVLRIKTIESRIMPFFALGCIGICSAWLLFRALVLGRPADLKLGYQKREMIVWGMFALFWILIGVLGFYSAAFLFLLSCQLFLRGRPTGKTLLYSACYALGVTLVLYLCFTVAVRMALPRGVLI